MFRGQSRYGPGSRHHTSTTPPQTRDREDPYIPHHPGQGHHPPSDPREMERQWPSPESRFRQYLVSPVPRPGYSNLPQTNQGYGPSQARPHSRQAHDFSPQTYWDYRDDYGYYDQGYYSRHYGYPDAGGWRTEGYHTRGQEQGWMGAMYTNQYGYGLRRDSGQENGAGFGRDRRESVENYDGSRAQEMWDSGELVRSKTSGLSSSSYELSQYINGSEPNDTVPASYLEPEAEPKVPAPLKFCLPHVAVSFGPAGQLVRVRPALASQGEPAQVELHSLEVILSDTREQNDMRDFPGPLAREDLHKVDIINFALKMAEACLKDESAVDASSAALLWHLLVLQCRQNGRIVGSDIAELLMQGQRSVSVCEEDRNMRSLIDLSESPSPENESLHAADLLTGNPRTATESSAQNLHNYTRLLLEGRKKEALELAMKGGLWGHALFLASKMDGRTYTSVLSRFTGNLVPSDPLQTLFQLLSGRVPVVATSYSREKWGDWRPHLAVVLSNETGDSDIRSKFLLTMGDTLTSRGLLHAAHICYLMDGSPFGCYGDRPQRVVLLGSAQSASFAEFCQNSAIRCTEALEYCRRLGDASYIIPSFQVYKFVYACRLLDCGLLSQAFHYCEEVAKALLRIPEPHLTLLREVIKLADRLKHSETGLDPDPAWLVRLQQRLRAQKGDDAITYVSAEDCPWSNVKSREYADLNPDVLFTSEVHTSPPQADPTPPYPPEEQSYPSEGHSYPSCPSQGHSYPSEGQLHPSEGHSYPSYPSQGQSYPSEGQLHLSEGHSYPSYQSQGQSYPSEGQSHPPKGHSYPSYPSQGQSYPSEGQSHPSEEGQSHPSEGHSYPSYPTEGQSYPTCSVEDQSYTPSVQPYDGQLVQTYAPVPVYPQQNVLAALTGQPQDRPGFPPVAAGQDGSNRPDTSYHHNTTGLVPEPCSDMDVGSSNCANVMDASENGTARGSVATDTTSSPELDAKEVETDQPKSEKATRSGWFSGWFRSKPKNATPDESKQTMPSLPGLVSDSSSPLAPGSPIPHPPGPGVPPSINPFGPGVPPIITPPGLPKAAGATNPFSRRAGQKPGVPTGRNFGSMSNAP